MPRLNESIAVNDERLRARLLAMNPAVAREIQREMAPAGRKIRRRVARDFERRTGKGNRAFFWLYDRSPAQERGVRQYRRPRTRQPRLDDLLLGVVIHDPRIIVHEEGARVRAENAEWLAVPVADARDGRGSIRRQYRDQRGKLDTTKLPGAEMVKIRGEFYLAKIRYSRGPEEGRVPLWIDRLYAKPVPYVDVPKNLDFFGVWRETKPEVMRDFGRAVGRGIRRSGDVARRKGAR